jgi:hypothetical protein
MVHGHPERKNVPQRRVSFQTIANHKYRHGHVAGFDWLVGTASLE